MKLIPAIDIIDGKCVRLTQGDYDQKKIYHTDPLNVARTFEENDLEYLHLVDLDGARAGRVVNHEILRRIVENTNLKVDFGGGVKSDVDLELAFASGARQVTGGTVAVKDRPLFLSWLERHGPEKIILGADAWEGKIAVSGWQEHSDLALVDFIESYLSEGIRYVICTDISKDGLLQGPAFDTYRDLRHRFPDLNLIASGGVSTLDDLKQLRDIGCHGAILGKAIYEERIRLEELAAMME